MNNPYLFHPAMAPFTPRPCPPVPPPPARHPGLYEDMDGYTRKEIDDADARTLASAKAYTDEKVLPATGIPKTSLAADVQASLSKADTALQEHQDISGKADLINGKVPSSQLPETPGQVQADWNEADTSDPSFIKNKPSSMAPTPHTHMMEDITDLANHRVWAATATTSQSEENTFILSPFGNDVVFEDGSVIIFQCPANITSSIWYVKVGANKHQLVWSAGTQSTLPLVKAGDTCIVMFEENKIDGFQYSLWRLYGNKAYTAYQKPASGIPASDLASGVLPDVSGKADSASLAPAFSASSTYAVGDYATYEGLLYKCTTAVSTAGAWNAANWTAVAVTDEMGADTPLPFDAEVEYIECSNVSTYLDFYINSLYDLEMEVYLPNGTASTDTAMLGRWTNSHSHLISAANSKFNVYYGGTSTTSINNAPPTGSWFTMSLQGSVASCNGQTTSVTRKYDTDGASKMMIIATNDARIRRARISYGPHDLMDLHPVRVGSTAYFYDSARGILVGIDAGTATPGPDKATPTITTPGRIVELTDSPAFTGTPTAPTAAAGTNTTQVATTEFVMAAIAALRTELTGNS